MFIIHFKLHKRALLAAVAILVLALALIFLVNRCGQDPADPIEAGTPELRIAYLEQLGWQVDVSPVETLDLQLPKPLNDEWQAYAKLQSQQGLPFDQFAGQQVKRYTYTVNNYPGIEKGVQINLYVSGSQLIGGDVIVLGSDGFQAGLAFPKQ